MSDTGTEEQEETKQPTLAPGVQEEVDKVLGKEKREATKAGKAALAKDLGFDSVEAMEKFVKGQKEAEKAKLDDAERKLVEALEKEEASATATATANAKAEDADILMSLIEAGADRKTAKKLIPNVRGEIEGDVDEESINKAIKELKKTFPTLFTGLTSPPPGGSNPAPPQPGAGKGDGQQYSKAQEILHIRHPQLKKT